MHWGFRPSSQKLQITPGSGFAQTLLCLTLARLGIASLKAPLKNEQEYLGGGLTLSHQHLSWLTPEGPN